MGESQDRDNLAVRNARMSETIDIEKARSPNPAWLAIPLLLFALMSLTVGLLARGAIRQPYPTPFFHLFFSDTLHRHWQINKHSPSACARVSYKAHFLCAPSI